MWWLVYCKYMWVVYMLQVIIPSIQFILLPCLPYMKLKTTYTIFYRLIHKKSSFMPWIIHISLFKRLLLCRLLLWIWSSSFQSHHLENDNAAINYIHTTSTCGKNQEYGCILYRLKIHENLKCESCQLQFVAYMCEDIVVDKYWI